MSAVLPNRIADAFGPILGSPAWQVEKGYASFLTLEFGEPYLVIHEPKTPSYAISASCGLEVNGICGFIAVLGN